MSDLSKTLPNSFGMPRVWLYDSSGKPIIVKDPWGNDINVNQLIVSFKYKYDEENDDECTIKIGILHVSQMNHPSFREDTRLKVQWGYLIPGGESIKSPMRLVAVRDTEKDYKADGISLELVCSDLISYLKNIRTTRVSDNNNFEDWLREILNDEYVATKTIGGYTRMIAKKKKGNKFINEQKLKSNIKETTTAQDEYKAKISTQTLQPMTKDKPLVNVKEIDQLEPDLIIKGKSKAIYNEIRERLNTQPGSPAYMNSRDDKLDIIVRDWNQPVYVTYTYAGGNGELIEFKPKSNVIITNDDQLENNYVNPKTKKVETTKIGKASGHTELPPGVSKLDANLYFSALKTVWEHNIKNPLNQMDVDTVNFDKVAKGGSYSLASNPDGSTRVAFKYRADFKRKVSAKSLIMSSHFSNLRREYFLENFIGKRVERKYEAQAKVIGDPSLITSKIYHIKGVGEYDKGNWYSAKVEHEITENNGYICKIELLKKPTLLGTLIERREYDHDQREYSQPNYTEVATIFEDNTFTNNMGFNEQDITMRLESLRTELDVVLVESTGDQAIPYQGYNQFNNSSNSAET